jgi:hypothetical protein
LFITKKGCTRLAAVSDKVYQLLAHGRWFSPGTPASSTTKTDRHDIAEKLLSFGVKQQSLTHSINTCLFLKGHDQLDIYFDSVSTNLYSFSLMLRAWRRSKQSLTHSIKTCLFLKDHDTKLKGRLIPFSQKVWMENIHNVEKLRTMTLKK